MARHVSRFSGTGFMTNEPPYGFGFRFSVEDDKTVVATVVFDRHKEGGQGILHGGAIAAVLDEAMGTAAFEVGKPGYTVTMTYNYKAHVPLHQPIEIRAWVDRVEGRKVFAACEAVLPDGKVAVNGSGIFIESDVLRRMVESNPYISEDGQ